MADGEALLATVYCCSVGWLLGGGWPYWASRQALCDHGRGKGTWNSLLVVAHQKSNKNIFINIYFFKNNQHFSLEKHKLQAHEFWQRGGGVTPIHASCTDTKKEKKSEVATSVGQLTIRFLFFRPHCQSNEGLLNSKMMYCRPMSPFHKPLASHTLSQYKDHFLNPRPHSSEVQHTRYPFTIFTNNGTP